MVNRVFSAFTGATIAASLLLATAAGPVSADDTEIYQAEYNAATGSRPKVLIVFDDSGSMRGEIDQQRPPYDPNATYNSSVSANRIYWSTDGSVPGTGSNNYFAATQNRCASSYDSLDDAGRFTPERARRWVNSSIQQGQCTTACPTGTTYRNPAGPNNAGCYLEVTTTAPAAKLVRVQNDGSNNSCPNSLIYVDPPGGNNDGCYEWQTSAAPLTGWIYRQNDSGNNCPSGLSRLIVDPPGSNNRYDACFEEVTDPELAETTEWQYSGPQVETCEADTTIPGSWSGLSSNARTPPHVECLDDVNNTNPDNGSGQADGFPQANATDGNEYDTSVDNNVDWGNTAYTFYTSHYMDWWHDDSLVQARSKIDIAADVITTIIDTNTSIDFGLLEFNRSQGGRVTQRIIQDMTANDRTNLMNLVDGLEPAGVTPLCESTYEAYLYLAGENPKYSGQASWNTTSNGWRHDEAPVDTAAISGGSYVSPNSDCAYTYVIIMTDGLPNDDTDANDEIETLTGTTCGNYDSEDGFIKNCMPDLAEYMATNDLDGDTTNGDQFGITYTIGFDTDQQLLQDTADKGKGEYYTAENAAELTEAFQGALVSILSRDTTFTSPAVAVDTFTRTQSRDEVFYAMFKPGESVDWVGNIKKLKLDIDNGTATLVDANGNAAVDTDTGDIKSTAVTFWGTGQDGGTVEEGGVGALLAARNPSGRSLYIDTGVNGALEALNTTNIDAAAMGAVSNAALYNIFGASTSAAFTQQIRWAQGYDAYNREGDANTDNTNNPRSWILGDILHSQPLVLNYGATGGVYTVANPDLRIIVGSNSGFVHMFKSLDGQESWAFFPKELASILPLRRRDAVSSDHVYGMDLTPVAYTYDANADGTIVAADGDKAWAYFGMRRGGSSYYALDVTNPNTPSFMWRIGPDVSGFGELGQSWSEPKVTRIPGYVDGNGVSKPVLIFGAGYDTNKDSSGVGSADSQGRGVFIVDAQTGALIWSVTPGANSANNMSETGLLNSVPGDVTVLDSNGDELTDRIYFGDTGGNLWRIDLPGNTLPTSTQDTWFISKLGDFNGGTAPTDRRFFNAPDVVRVRFDGEAVDAVVIGSGDRTNPNATDVDNSLYMVRDRGTVPYSTDVPTTTECSDPDFFDFRCGQPYSDSDLYNITDNVLTNGTDTEKAAAKEALRLANGWRLDLANAGEKSLAKTLTINGRIFATTFTPSTLLNDINVCEPQAGTGLLYVIDLYEGDRSTINLGGIIPDTPSVHFGDDGQIRVLLPPGTPATSVNQPGEVDCSGGVCDVNEFLRAPYGNYWFQEDY
ncbi:hypothetical protein C0039_16720 [Pseudohalioglobus lutimaris]|uniref:PilY1 beta-propeller domain-containing protein n=2 Tax=Pseudohalioglobus lutimaris TaxID=1737061 RepID=A0A2N5WZA2_9GAMM|nr:hypothetical protein C0039_16720 [Pseudohalioglobus lutimaris]